MISGEVPAYDPGIGSAVVDVATAWDARMLQEMRQGRQIVALRGAGSVNGIDPAAADNVVELLEPQITPDVVFIFDGDPDDPAKRDIGYVAGRLLDLGATVVAAQTDNWYYPATPGANLTNAHGEPYETFVIPRGLYPGDHNRLTQSEQLAAYPRYSQTYVGAAGLIASAQMVDYCRNVPEGGQVNVTVIKAAHNGSLSEEIGRKLAQAVDEADRQKLQSKLNQRRQTFGVFWDNDGNFKTHVLSEMQREEDTHELAVLWDVDSRVEKVDILNCRKIDLSLPEADRAFAEARYYVKTRPVVARQIPKNTSERIVVKSGATGDIAKAGDWVCRKQNRDGSYGEEYVVHAEDFIELYDSTPDSESIFVPKRDPRKLVQVNTDVIFMAPWGEKQAVRRGGYLMERTKKDGTVERYGISQIDAETDFELLV